MGKHANSAAYREFERLDRQRQDASFESEPELTEAERAAEWDSEYWTRLDATADELAEARRGYAVRVGHIELWDEARAA